MLPCPRPGGSDGAANAKCRHSSRSSDTVRRRAEAPPSAHSAAFAQRGPQRTMAVPVPCFNRAW